MIRFPWQRAGVGAVVVTVRKYLRVETNEKNSVGIIVGSNFSSTYFYSQKQQKPQA